MLGLWPWDGATIRSRRFTRFMRHSNHLMQAGHISPEANNLIRDILRFHPELRLSIPEISARVLELHSFFDNPCIGSTTAELQGMEYAYKHMLTRVDPVAWRRKELERLRSLNGTSTFNDLTSRLPLPWPQSRIRVSHSPENPPTQTHKPHCVPIPDVPPPVTMQVPEEPTRSNKWWRLEKLKQTSSWYYP